MEMRHTPTPWRDSGDGLIVGPDSGDVVASVRGDYDEPIRTANKAFIVRAVNAHDELVAALRATKEDIESAPEFHVTHGGLYDMVCAALAKAEGK